MATPAAPTDAVKMSLYYDNEREDPMLTLWTEDSRTLGYPISPTEALALARYLTGWVGSGMRLGTIDPFTLERTTDE